MVERDLYEPVRAWFERTLADRFRRAKVKAYDTSRTRLCRFIERLGLQGAFPESGVWDIQADITAFVLGRENNVAVVECKTTPVTLKDVGQILGYSRVARPLVSTLLSVRPPSDSLQTLLSVYGRYDILEYANDRRRILVVRWDPERNAILHAETLPPGEHI